MPDDILPDAYHDRARATSVVTFLHRSVSEFMMASPSYLGLLRKVHPHGIERALLLLHSAIANVKAHLSLMEARDIFRNVTISAAVRAMVYNALHWARIVGDRGRGFVEELDAAMGSGTRHLKLQNVCEKWHWTGAMGETREEHFCWEYGTTPFVTYATRHGLESVLLTKLEGSNGSKPDAKESSYFLVNAVCCTFNTSPSHSAQRLLHLELPISSDYRSPTFRLLCIWDMPTTFFYLHLDVPFSHRRDTLAQSNKSCFMYRRTFCCTALCLVWWLGRPSAYAKQPIRPQQAEMHVKS